MTETNRQKKIAGVLQNDFATVITQALRDAGVQNILVSVTKVRVTTDLSLAKAYLSIFPHDTSEVILKEINQVKPQIKHQVALMTKNQLRRMPEVEFFIDDSLEHIDQVDRAMKGDENPILDRDLLEQRKKK